MTKDTFTNIGTAGVMGTMTGGEVKQYIGGGVDFAKLATDLEKLHLALMGAASADPELTAAANSVAEAQTAAKSNDEKGVLSALARIGGKSLEVALEVGKKIVADLAVNFLKRAAGIP